MMNIICEEIEESVALSWRDLEGERDQLRELQHKTAQDLQISQGQVGSQTVLLKTATEEANMLHGELSKSQGSHALLSNENGRLVGDSQGIERSWRWFGRN